MPKSWTDDPQRCAAAGIPEGLGLATRPQLAQQMPQRALDADVPFAWVTAQWGAAVSTLEAAVRRATGRSGRAQYLDGAAQTRRGGKPRVGSEQSAVKGFRERNIDSVVNGHVGFELTSPLEKR